MFLISALWIGALIVICHLTGKHPFAFGKKFYDYVRVVGPGVVVGQSWYGSASGSEVSRNSELGPRKYLGEFLLIQNYAKVSS